MTDPQPSSSSSLSLDPAHPKSQDTPDCPEGIEEENLVASDVDLNVEPTSVIMQPDAASDSLTNPSPKEPPTPAAELPVVKRRTRPKPSSDPASPLIMPGIASLPMHAPSQIVSTPFLTTTPFEYPFPDTQSTSSNATSPGSHHTTSSGPSPTSSPPNTYHGSPAPWTPFSSNPSLLHAQSRTPPPTQIHYIPPSYPYSYSGQHIPEFSGNLTHPKMKQVTPPPLPPSLAKKKHRWSLGLLGRRKSSPTTGSDGDASAAAGLMTLAALERHREQPHQVQLPSRGASMDITPKTGGNDSSGRTLLEGPPLASPSAAPPASS